MHPALPFLVLLVACEGGDAGKETGPVDSGGSSMVDADGDGFALDVDCNDADAAVHPGADELCDDLDNDCDGLVDESDPDLVGADTWYLDADLDGYGGLLLVTEACDVPDGFVDNQGDCNDLDASIHPGADELCDDADNELRWAAGRGRCPGCEHLVPRFRWGRMGGGLTDHRGL